MLRVFRGWLTRERDDTTESTLLPARDDGDDSDVNLLDPSVDPPDQDTEHLIDVDLPENNLYDTAVGEFQNTSPTTPVPINEPTACVIASPDGGCASLSDARHAISRRERAYRHRSRRHRHHHRSRHRICRCKRKETNFLASVCSMIVVVLVCTSLAEPEWFYISGGKCKDARQLVNYLGVKLFFYQGMFVNNTHSWIPPSGISVLGTPRSVYYYGSAKEDVLIDCVTQTEVFVMKCIIMNCFIVIVFSLTAFILDLVGPTHKVLRAIRTNAICSILSVCICVTINGLCYLVTEQLSGNFASNPYRYGSKIDVQFSLSFYIITAAGAISVVATACNLFQKPSHSSSSGGSGGHSAERRDRYLAELIPEVAEASNSFSACSQLAFLSSPPPYSP